MNKPSKTPRHWYRDREQAILDGWPDSLQGVQLTLANYQTLGDLMAILLEADPTRDGEEARDAALAAFAEQHEIRGGKWRPVVVYRLQSGITFPNPRSPQPEIESRRSA